MKGHSASNAGLDEITSEMQSTPSADPEPDFQRLIECAPDGMLVVDASGTVLYANPAAAHLFGSTVAELEKVPIGRPAITTSPADLVTRRLDGHARQLEMRVVAVSWDGREALFATLRDVSTQRVLEAQSHQAQKLEAVGRLAAGVAHDFNNILAVVRAGISLILKRTDTIDDDGKKLLHELHERTEGGAELVRKLLTFSREQELVSTPVDINGRIESLGTLLRATLGDHIDLEIDLDDTLPTILVDVSHLEAAVVNLVINSRDAIGESGTIRILTKMVSDRPHPMCNIVVEDDGCGMPATVVDKAIEPFFTTKQDHGTGLGLSQVYGFANQSGGDIHIESRPNSGTRVTIMLPITRR